MLSLTDWSFWHVQKCAYWTQIPDTVSGTALGITCGVEPNLLYELIVESCLFFFSFFFFSLEQTWYLAAANSCTEYLCVLVLGEEHQCSQAFVVISGIALEHPSLLGAVDGCFKAFFVLDVNYPKPCAQVWEFIPACIFEITGRESNAVMLIRSQLAVMESSSTPAS